MVPTPIGNLGDITARALDALREADVVFAEDTRRTGALLAHFEIHKPMRSLFVGNERTRSAAALGELRAGKVVALVSDAGTPGISDPGAYLIQAAIAESIAVEALPGAQAILPALLLSGLPPAPFTFVGFLPRARAARREVLKAVRDFPWTLVFYEAPHRLAAMLGDAHAVLGPRPAAVVREISKVHEETRRGDLGTLASWAEAEPPRGEIAVVVGGAPAVPATGDPTDLGAFIAARLEQGDSPTAAARAGRDAGFSRQEAYREALRQAGKAPHARSRSTPEGDSDKPRD